MSELTTEISSPAQSASSSLSEVPLESSNSKLYVFGAIGLGLIVLVTIILFFFSVL